MPAWAKDNPRQYWQAADEHERANGRLFREVEFALPVELGRHEQVKLARRFAQDLTGEERLPYTLAIHRGESRDPGKPDNPHCHLMISERSNDGIERSAATWSRHTSATTRRSRRRAGHGKASRPRAASGWRTPARPGPSAPTKSYCGPGSGDQIHEGSLERQYREAVEAGDYREAERLEGREPGQHIGPANLARAERGEDLERVAAGPSNLGSGDRARPRRLAGARARAGLQADRGARRTDRGAGAGNAGTRAGGRCGLEPVGRLSHAAKRRLRRLVWPQ